jgi:homocysteine S-methyltransferase
MDVLCYPNRGEAWDADGRQWCATTDSVAVGSDIGAMAKAWVGAGATVLGGCCRVRPAEITAMKQATALL